MRIMPNQEPEAATPDGISRGDWEMVHQCAVDIATAADDDVASQQSTRRLLQMLERLEHRYGPLPSILATRADYTEDASGRLALYQAAYDVASSREDARNLVWVASSLAELYAEELRDPTSAWSSASTPASRSRCGITTSTTAVSAMAEPGFGAAMFGLCSASSRSFRKPSARPMGSCRCSRQLLPRAKALKTRCI